MINFYFLWNYQMVSKFGNDSLDQKYFWVDLTLSCRRPISYRNQSIDLHSKSMDWFLCDVGLRHERVNLIRKGFLLLIAKLIFCPKEFYSVFFKTLWLLQVFPMEYLKCRLTFFIPLVSFYTPWKHQETRGYLIFSGGIERPVA